MADRRIGQIKRYVTALHPKLLGLASVGSVRISELNRGGYNLNYRVDIDGRSFVFRLNLDAYLDVENQTVYEQEVMQAVEPASIAPKVFFIDTKKDVLDHDLLVEEYLDHEPLRFGTDFLEEAGKLVKRLHAIPLPVGTGLIRNSHPLQDQWKFIQGKVAYIKANSAYPEFIESFTKHTPAINAYVSRHAPKFRGDDICVNHRDLVIENILSTNKGLRLVDWQSAMADDPSYDLSYFSCPLVAEWNLGRPMQPDEAQAFFRGYQIDEALWHKVHVRQPMVNLELLIYVAFRSVYVRNKLATNGVHNADTEFFEKRIAAYEKLLDEKRMTQYLEAFHDYA